MKTDEAQSAHQIIKMDRRTLLKRAAVLGGGAALGALLPPWAQSVAQGMPSTMPMNQFSPAGFKSRSRTTAVNCAGSIILPARP